MTITQKCAYSSWEENAKCQVFLRRVVCSGIKLNIELQSCIFSIYYAVLYNLFYHISHFLFISFFLKALTLSSLLRRHCNNPASARNRMSGFLFLRDLLHPLTYLAIKLQPQISSGYCCCQYKMSVGLMFKTCSDDNDGM